MVFDAAQNRCDGNSASMRILSYSKQKTDHDGRFSASSRMAEGRIFVTAVFYCSPRVHESCPSVRVLTVAHPARL